MGMMDFLNGRQRKQAVILGSEKFAMVMFWIERKIEWGDIERSEIGNIDLIRFYENLDMSCADRLYNL